MALKTSIRERITEVVETVELPEGIEVAEEWSDYAARVVSTLKGAA
jgi:hypothetical protein